MEDKDEIPSSTMKQQIVPNKKEFVSVEYILYVVTQRRYINI